MTRTTSLPALAAAAVTVCLWASAFVGIRSAGDELSAGPLSLGRLLVGGAVLAVFVLIRREPLPPRGDLGRLCLVGVAVTRAQRSPARGMRTSTAPAGGSSPGA